MHASAAADTVASVCKAGDAQRLPARYDTSTALRVVAMVVFA